MMGSSFGMGGGWIFMILFWVLLVGLIIWAVSELLPGARSDRQRRSPTAIDLLDRRFALGEMDVEQYRQAREERVAHAGAKR
jgi:putative membrane protein